MRSFRAMLAQPKDSDDLPLSGYTPRNLFKREVIGAHRFRQDIRYAEDLLFIVCCMLEAKRAVAVDRAYYHYRCYEGSVTKHFSFHIPESYENPTPRSTSCSPIIRNVCGACASDAARWR